MHGDTLGSMKPRTTPCRSAPCAVGASKAPSRATSAGRRIPVMVLPPWVDRISSSRLPLKLFPDQAGHRAPVGPALGLAHYYPDHLPHVLRGARAGARDRVPDQSANLLLAELGGQVSHAHVDLALLARDELGATHGAQLLHHLAPLLHVALDDLDLLLGGERGLLRLLGL